MPTALVGLLLVVCSRGVNLPMLVSPPSDITTFLNSTPHGVPIASNGSQLFLADLSSAGNSVALGVSSSWFQNCSTPVTNVSSLASGEGFLPPYLDFRLNISDFASANIPNIRNATVAQVGGQTVIFAAVNESIVVYEAALGFPPLGEFRWSGRRPVLVLFRAFDNVLFVSDGVSEFGFVNVTDFGSMQYGNLGYGAGRAWALSWDGNSLYVFEDNVLSSFDVTPGFGFHWLANRQISMDIFVKVADAQVADPTHIVVLMDGDILVLMTNSPGSYSLHISPITSMALGFVPGETQSKRRLYVMSASGSLNSFEFDLDFDSVSLVDDDILRVQLAQGMAVVGTTLYLVDRYNLSVVDVAAPGAQLLATTGLGSGFGRAIVVHDGRAFIAGDHTLHVVEVKEYFLQVNSLTPYDPSFTFLTVFGIDAFGGVAMTTFSATLVGGAPCNASKRPTAQPTRLPTLKPTSNGSPTTPPTRLLVSFRMPEECLASCFYRQPDLITCTARLHRPCDCHYAAGCPLGGCNGDDEDDWNPDEFQLCAKGGRCDCDGGAVACMCAPNSSCCYVMWTDLRKPAISCLQKGYDYNQKHPSLCLWDPSVIIGFPSAAVGGSCCCFLLGYCCKKQRQKRRKQGGRVVPQSIPMAVPIPNSAELVPRAPKAGPEWMSPPVDVPSLCNETLDGPPPSYEIDTHETEVGIVHSRNPAGL